MAEAVVLPLSEVPPEPGEAPEELFDLERMANHARRLARAQSVRVKGGVGLRRGPRLLLRESYGGLSKAYRRLVEEARREQPLPPAADWLLDNFYVIRDAARQLRDDLPFAYYRVLPKLEGGALSGRPRIYEAVSALADRTDNVLDERHLWTFFSAFQDVAYLEMSELWALPAMVRLVLLQKLSALAAQVSETLEERDDAARWAQRVVARAAEDPSEVVIVLAEMVERHAPLSGSFVVTLTAALRAEGPAAASALEWLERRLATRGLTIDEVVRHETQRQTHRQASVANAIMALRRVGDLEWAALVESLAVVDRTLRQDPAGVYAAMDFPTRDRYRHVVERLARYSPATELGVAERVVGMAEAAQERLARPARDGGPDGAPPVETHVGYWLVERGLREVEREVGYRPPLRRRVLRFGRRWPGLTYLCAVGLLLAGLMAGAWGVAAAAGAVGYVRLLTLAASLLPALDLAVALAQWLVVRVFPPRRLPKLAFEGGVPPEHRTLVVVPTILTSPDDARRQVERLEVHALANPDPAFRFALLSDFPDAPEEAMPADAATLAAAREAVRDLNARWRRRPVPGDGAPGRDGVPGDRFFLLHRARRWNAAEGVWMGWERKRGKLEELNALLRDPDAATTYTTVEGDFRAAVLGPDEKPDAVRYVVTLDADTQLPPGAAHDLVRTAAHPLNRPVYDPRRGRVVRGYGILQPRVGIAVEVERWTPFARIFSGEPGVDPYTTAVSDVYQDLFGVGIFTGKGLYDVDAFRRALDGAIPENTVLSHDLLEGNYARAALVTDVLLFDEYPSSYAAFARRLHRWVRGDWQILPWLFGRVRDGRGQRRRNPVPLLGRWKTFDNLRRSLTPPAVLLFLLLGWTVLPGSPFLWTLLGVGILAFPIYARFTSSLLAHPREARWSVYLRGTLAEVRQSTAQAVLSVTFLAHQALLMLDAVARTLWRMAVSRRKRLEWTTAQQAERSAGDAPGIWLSTLVGAGVLALVVAAEPVVVLAAAPFAAVWIAAPWVARRLSRRTEEEAYAFTAADRARLRRVARRTWRFFDDFVTEADHWLVPDNFQEQPFRGLARRTSPTNVGMALLAVQAAHDLGYATRTEAVARLGRTFETLRGLERHGGHLYNWYATDTAEPLAPRYVSTVDSGNLVASLLALRQALMEAPAAPWPSPAFFDGLRDTLACLEEALADEQIRASAPPVAAAAKALAAALPAESPERTSAYRRALDALDAPARALAAAGDALADAPGGGRERPRAEVRYWASRPLRALEAARAEVDAFAPWAEEEDAPEPLDAARSLRGLLAATRRAVRDGAGEGLGAGAEAVARHLAAAAALAAEAEAMALAHDFRLLYDVRRDLFYIGYNADSGQADAGTYDLLASECRLASLVAIGKGDVEAEHWFRLGRPTTNADGYRTLVSWSGTMFEYLMPLLFTRRYPGSLLDETCLGALGIQRAYARRWGRPWGLSESAYHTLDIHLTYQYRAFGVPGLGLKRGLADDYVAAPYATLLGLLVRPDRALANLDRLREVDAYGPYGYYEAVDFTRERLPPGRDHAVVRAYMAHHQGMGLLAVVNALTGASRTSAGLMQQRFHREPLVRSVELLLQERVPRELDLIVPHPDELEDIEPVEVAPPRPAVVHVPAARLADPTPAGLLLSNGRHTTFVTAAGAGYARVGAAALTRWTPDRTREHDGVFLYVRDVESGRFWSAGMQPAGGVPDRYEAWFHLAKAEIARVDDWIETFTEVAVSPEDDVEVRRYTLTNYSDRPRELELTTYAEVVLTDPAADAAHPAFSKLFVRTEADQARGTLLATRRAREAGRQHPWLFHVACAEGARTPRFEYETDRMRFVGRNRSLADPAAMDGSAPLSGTTGPVLDPVVSLRRRVRLKPKEKKQVAFVLGSAPTRDDALRLADRYRHPEAVQRAFDLAGVYGLVELPHFGLSAERALYAQQLGTALLYGAPHLRAPERVLMRNRRGQPGLWAYGISGDLPIVVAHVRAVHEVAVVRALLQMHAYWRQRGLEVDLVVLNAHPPSYADEVQQQLQQAVETSASRGLVDRPGGVFLRRTEGMPDEDLTLLLTAARVVVEGALPDLQAGEPVEEPAALPHVREPLARLAAPSVRSRLLAAAAPAPMPAPEPERAHPDAPAIEDDGPPSDADGGDGLRFFNGYGGFTPRGREYVVRLDGAGPASTPLPWTNVVANPRFGFLATESGLGMAWQGNSQMNKLTPWSNDPVMDPAGDALYLRDEDEGVFWSPTPQPVPGPGRYETRHGWGYTRYRHTGHGIESDALAFVPREDPVQVVRLRLTNRSDRPRRLSAFRYAAWVLGDRREKTEPFVVVRPDLGTGALFARNRYSAVFGEAIAFADAVRLGTEDATAGITHTADRTAFLGRGGSPSSPAAVRSAAGLDGRLGAGLDPCAAFAVPVALQPGESAEVVFLLGQAASRDGARALVRRYRDAATCEAAFEAVTAFWDETLGALRVRTPVEALDVLVNGWLLYQNLACRLWARSAFYQSGGAFGFRDQIQDALALLFTRPDLTRAQLLLHAAHQFEEGDVLHWWHPQTGAGVRTRFSDDLLWLPYATATYLHATGDRAVLDAEAPFLTARELQAGEDEVYLTPEVSDETGTLFEHGCRALDRSLTEGPHGLPLMGSGDWNDGMNRVGHEGRGESVWLGFFLFDILADWVPLCEGRGEAERAARYRTYADALRERLNETGWDGAWYRRAYFDDGTPLGSAENAECRIDAIAQAWAVLSGAGDEEKVARALASAREHLVDERAGLIRLLTPPFDRTEHDPGYIKGYLPGVRENGGQYTHGVLWLVRAFAERGEGGYATRLLQMLLPATDTATREAAEHYRTEPYAVAADVYGADPHVGRGGWTWYTGSAGWMYRVAVESILGLTLEGGTHLRLDPRIPADWPGFSLRYRRGESVYVIEVTNAGVERGVRAAALDGEALPVEDGAVYVPLADDGREHRVEVRLGPAGPGEAPGGPA